MKVAILKHHEWPDWRAIELPPGQSVEFDEGSATRRWLHPALGTEWHLLKIVDTETVSNGELKND
jgi:hypothetical protein